MQKRDRANRSNDERKVKKWNFFVKKKGGMRFAWLERFHYWWLGGRSITRSIFRIVAAWQGVAIISGVLATGYVMAAFYTGAGEFVIRVDHPGEKKMILSDTPDFPEERITLKGKAIKEADNISIFDIDPQVAEIDGEHNGPDYVAYTFYVKNIGYDPITYNYALSIRRATQEIDKATWVLLYHNGKQQIFAAPSASGGVESQYSEYEFPFRKDARDPQRYQLDEKKGIYQLQALPFASSKIVATAQRDNLQPQEVDKFTVVIWLEGEDPECGDDILGGTIEMMMKFRY